MVALKGMPDIGDPITAVVHAFEVTRASFGPLNQTQLKFRHTRVSPVAISRVARVDLQDKGMPRHWSRR
ncbi:MAG TPA: hypothetical protein DHV85_10625, partial [Candidatus Accumulibacter sp.]|nr:hypothetical protein [Accumulibacter sp.]